MTVQLRGVLTALATPFAADGSVDERACGPGGPVDSRRGARGRGGGSTGEFTALSSDERRLVVETSSTRSPAACR